MRHFSRWTLVALTLSVGVNTKADPQPDPQPEETAGGVLAAEYESYALSHKSGFAKVETRIGDYAVTIEKGLRKGSGSDNKLKQELSFTTSTTAGGVATTQVRKESSFEADYSRVCSSFSELIVDTLLEEHAGASICSDHPDFRKTRTVIRATIGLKDKPGAGWQLDALTQPPADELGSTSVWGLGELADGERRLLLTYRSDSPWTEAQCLEMRQARDERKWDCYRKVVEIESDGELLAWFASNENTYTFRAGLDDDLKLAVLAAIEAFRKGISDHP
jgi:hypothetical protein